VFYGFLSPISTYLAADPAEVGFGFGFDAALVSISETAILLTTALAAVITSPLLAKLKSKWTIIAGGILAIASFLDLALVAGNSLGKLIAFIALSGLGLGIISAATPIIIPEIVPTGEKGLATGLFNSCQTLGGALGSGLFLALLLTGATNSGDVTVIGYNTVWFTCAGLLASGVLVFGLLYQENIEQRIKNKEQGVKNDD
jgi:MFS family permease